MSEHDAFTVTVASNNCKNEYPDNKGTKFTARMTPALDFGGRTLNDEHHWEMALTSIEYTNMFYNLPETITVRAVVTYADQTVIDNAASRPYNTHSFPARFNGGQMTEYVKVYATKGTHGDMDRTDRGVVRIHTRQNSMIPENGRVVFGKFFIPAGYYATGTDAYNKFLEKYNELFDTPRYKAKMGGEVLQASGNRAFVLPVNTLNVFIYVDKISAARVLGMEPGVVRMDPNFPDEVWPDLWELSTNHRSKPPSIDALQSLYVYCDGIKYQHVGNVLTPLLDVIPVEGAPGERVHHVPRFPMYITLDSKYMDRIEIQILDENGREVPFPDALSNVVCRLRFRHSTR